LGVDSVLSLRHIKVLRSGVTPQHAYRLISLVAETIIALHNRDAVGGYIVDGDAALQSKGAIAIHVEH
jgi:hypothetical protein